MKLLVLAVLISIASSADELSVLKSFAFGNNQFAADVYKELLKSNNVGSFLVCPLSVETILALVHDGARGQTAQQLSSGLHLPADRGQIRQIFHYLTPHLKGTDKYALSSANKVYVKKGYKVREQFKSTAVNVFGADIQNVDFDANEAAAGEINRWVAEKTNNKILGLINKDDLTPNTRAVLVNAMYFHGKWVNEFPERATTRQPFHISRSDQLSIEMMQQLNYLKFYVSPELKAKFLELPYEGEDISMTIVLPDDVEGLPLLEANIERVLVAPNYTPQLVEVKIPKFKVETTILCNDILKSLGITTAFTDSADFEDILTNQRLKIDKVIQKTFIEVEEKGTKASAATAVEMGVPLSSHYVPPPVMEFIADHPFIYYIKIKDILFFVGRFTAN